MMVSEYCPGAAGWIVSPVFASGTGSLWIALNLSFPIRTDGACRCIFQLQELAALGTIPAGGKRGRSLVRLDLRSSFACQAHCRALQTGFGRRGPWAERDRRGAF